MVLGSVLIPLAVGMGAHVDGLRGAALAWLAVYPVVYLYSMAHTGQVLRVVAVPIVAGACMIGSVWACRALLGENVYLGLRLAAGIVTGGVTYLLVLWVIARPLLLNARSLALDLLRPQRNG